MVSKPEPLEPFIVDWYSAKVWLYHDDTVGLHPSFDVALAPSAREALWAVNAMRSSAAYHAETGLLRERAKQEKKALQFEPNCRSVQLSTRVDLPHNLDHIQHVCGHGTDLNETPMASILEAIEEYKDYGYGQ